MATTVMLPSVDARRVQEALEAHYEGAAAGHGRPFGGDGPVIYANTLAGSDSLRLIVCGHARQAIVTALFDNLGKGASGRGGAEHEYHAGSGRSHGIDGIIKTAYPIYFAPLRAVREKCSYENY